TDAVYRAGDANPGTIVKAIVRQPDRVGTYGETRIAMQMTLFDIRTSDINAPAEGDTIEMDGAVYVIQGEPIRDAEWLIWTIEARPQ
ncbi:MAG: head-tail joining protein, partial [Hyphomicrobium sp.]